MCEACAIDSKVIESRLIFYKKRGGVLLGRWVKKRRRQCRVCGHRFTTKELMPNVSTR